MPPHEVPTTFSATNDGWPGIGVAQKSGEGFPSHPNHVKTSARPIRDRPNPMPSDPDC